jgi:hypothetical protein
MDKRIEAQVPGIGQVIAIVEETKLATGSVMRYVKSAVYAGTDRAVEGAPLTWVQEYLGS